MAYFVTETSYEPTPTPKPTFCSEKKTSGVGSDALDLSFCRLSDPLPDELSLHLPGADDRRGVLRVGPAQVEVVRAFGDEERDDRTGNASQDAAGRPRIEKTVAIN